MSTIEMIEPAETFELEPATKPSGAVVAAQQGSDDLLLVAMQRGYTVEQMSALMDLRDRQARFVREAAFREDFAAFHGENITVPKTKEVDRGKAGSFVQAEYHVASLLLKPALSKHGFGFRHGVVFGSRKWITDGIENDIPWVWVKCYLEHRSGHAETLELEGPPGELSANTPAQNMQATASYLKRQSLLAITGTATGGEDDENKLRSKPATESEGSANESETMLLTGRAASLEGMKALTAWWGKLNAKQRSAMNSEFAGLRKAAARCDQEAGRV